MLVTVEREKRRFGGALQSILRSLHEKEYLLFFDGTLDDFHALEEVKAEFLKEGTIVMQSPASLRHEDIYGHYFSQMRSWVDEKRLGKILGSRFTISFDRQYRFEPDIVFISQTNPGFFTEYEFVGIPDLIIEIVSKTTRNYDLKTKREIYRKYQVKEIYFIDYMKEVIVIDIFRKEGYENLHLREGEFESNVINGLKFKAKWEFTIKE